MPSCRGVSNQVKLDKDVSSLTGKYIAQLVRAGHRVPVVGSNPTILTRYGKGCNPLLKITPNSKEDKLKDLTPTNLNHLYYEEINTYGLIGYFRNSCGNCI